MNSPGHRIVCAAVRIGGKFIVAGVRHFDLIMKDAIVNYYSDCTDMEDYYADKKEQGFLDNKYQYLTREEAWKVAEAAGQIIRRVGGDTINGGRLFSENLY